MDLAAAPPRATSIADDGHDPYPAADETLVLRRAARAAEDAGNAEGARRLVRLLPADPERARWLRSLDEAVALGPTPSPGPLALWLLQPALRFGLGSLRAGAVRLLMHEVQRARGAGPARRVDEPTSTSTAGAVLDDPLLADAALFDVGLLEAYVASALDPALRDRAAPLADWPAAAVGVFELTEREGALLARNLLDDREIRVATSPSASRPGPVVYGRPVPWPAAPGARFVLPPVPLDRVTARRVLRAVTRRAPVEERVRAVAGHQRRSGTAPATGPVGA